MSPALVAVTVLAGLSLAVWLVLVFSRGGFWRCDVRDDAPPLPPEPLRWPSVTVVVPARDEADVLPQTLASLLALDYPGPLSIILVDDNSSDGTGAIAKGIAQSTGDTRLGVVAGAPLPPGWTGKLWAVAQGVAAATTATPSTGASPPKYLLLTDADIAYRPAVLRRSVARAEAGELALVSLMARLRCESPAERALIPSFIFFFQMLYPFLWVNDPRNSTAAAAGGSMLVRTTALVTAGGIAAIRDALIDDCALGQKLKAAGPIWLGLADGVVSLRAYPRVRDIARMVSRSAYAELHYSPLRLAGAVLGLAVTYLSPPLITLLAPWPAWPLALAAWALMTLAFMPILRFYRLSPLTAPALPLIAGAYLVFTLESAIQYTQGRGGLWKGRAQALVKGSVPP